MTPAPDSGAGTLVLSGGPLETEAFLLERLDALAAEAKSDPRVLATPVRVVVPSGALRTHVAARVARSGLGLGVLVQTLDALALEALDRCGETVRRGELLLDAFVRRAAREEPSLAFLRRLEDGATPLVAVVRDLLDAGLDEGTQRGFEEALAALRTTQARRERAQALSRVVARVRAAADEAGVLLNGDAFAAANRALDPLSSRDPRTSGGGDALPARALFCVGFADVTGRVADLLETLARGSRLEFVLERPLELAARDGCADEDRGARFTDPLEARLGALLPERRDLRRPDESQPSPIALPTLLRAPTREAEVRAALAQVRARLDEGVAPERIAVVARDLGPFRAALATHAARLGVPLTTGRAPGLADASTGRLGSLLQLLEEAEHTSVDRWLDIDRQRFPLASGEGFSEPQVGRLATPELRLGLRVLGCARLEDLQELDLETSLTGRSSLPLPLHRPLQDDGDDEAAAETQDHERDALEQEPLEDERTGGASPTSRSGRRHVAATRLRAARAAARGLVEGLAAWPREVPAAGHAQAIRALLEHLHWTADQTATRRLERALADLVESTHDVPLRAGEFVRLLRRALERHARPAFGGGPSGVRVLEVMEARGRTFEHLYVLGLERGLFPRAGGEDALLSDALRLSLTTVLPELPVKRRRQDEERHLFANLVRSGSNVQLSHAEASDDGQALLPSPLFLRLRDAARRRAGVEPDAEDDALVGVLPPALPASFADAFPTRDRVGSGPRSATELAALTGVFASAFDEGARARVRAAALAEAGVSNAAAGALDAHRAAVLFEAEGAGGAPRLGPWFGLLGAAREGWPDPFREPQAVTRYEHFARCGWQLFLERVLRLEPLPDPLGALPTIDARQLGDAVHRALEALVLGAFPEESARRAPRPLEELLERPGAPVAWPATLAVLAEEAARRELTLSGNALPGLVQGLARRVVPYLERARAALDAAEDDRVALGAEARGRVELELDSETPLQLQFVVDRVDRVEGRLELVDYKTGKPWFDSKTPKTRARKLVEQIRAGQSLQGIAYALSSGGSGRYLFLRDGVQPHALWIDVLPDAPEFEDATGAFEASVGTIAAAWRAGVFLPRLLAPGGSDRQLQNPACAWCRVSEACLRGDSAATRRLASWDLEGVGRDDTREFGAAYIARELWNLGAADD